MKYEEIKPASRLYIKGYNAKAAELGIPMYNTLGHLIHFIVLVVLDILCEHFKHNDLLLNI
jgi:hypothetical protein